ncbi:DHH family phosphoesterase [Ligilactobacillus araffinosus]|uniref:Cyclic-di-AMP phosphodiesterase n=1 Tax=Ligilactobacillus araffinosus DSM 20653 TaxID=1423820 RepID=A0A0R1ZRL1_9LACO|nr:DHH family phosphoesterase [Ligilactobacillus araffinosus]KRM53196.1 phosphoesterase, DHH family protein [Ligilactobacillus araffinosus DSM 20653]
MEKRKSKKLWRIPGFMQDRRMRLIALFILGLAIVSDGLAFFISPIVGIIVLVLAIVTMAVAYTMLQHLQEETSEYISDLSYRLKRGGQDSLIRMPIGTIFFNDKYEIEWINPYMQRYFGKEDVLGKKISDLDEDLATILQDHYDDKERHRIHWHDHDFDLLIQKDIGVAYMMDITHYVEIQRQYDDSHVMIGQIFLDNYDEISKAMSDKDISNLSNFVTSALSDWAKKFGMFLKRVDEDHYVMIGYTGTLRKLEQQKFSILDKIRERTFKSNSPITLSIGIAYGEDDLNELTELSQSNLDLALGRGGDQVVVRESDGEARFYGGKTNPMAKRTRVRARVISQALSELLKQSDQVFVMGHKRPDMDAIGACLGIRRIAAMNGKKCWIILNQDNIHSDVRRLVDELGKYPEIKDSIISPAESLEKITPSSLLVLADHSKPSISISQELYDQLSNRVVIIDHHRRGEEFPENPILVYIEPYASSTCELIAEMFEYQSRDSEPINSLEATAMLTGIIVDTQSFSQGTGTRTFDAASYLRSMGADLTMARHFMKESESSYMQRNHLIDRTEFIDNVALCVGEDDQIYDSVIAAQAADSLLQVSGIQATFAITRRDEHTIGISARSDGTINVQVIMEELGGGGHLANAATQIKDISVLDAREKVLEILNKDEEPQSETED